MAMITITIFLVLLGQLTAGVPMKNHHAAIAAAPRIVGGEDAPDNFAPHMMALVFGEWVTSLMCGAAIVSDKHALTAAHCVDALLTWDQQGLTPTTRGVYGSNRWDSTEQSVRFRSHLNHPEWDSWNIKNDIAVLWFHKDDILTRSKSVSAIPVGTKFVGGGVDCYVTGWGRLSAWGIIPDILQYINVKTIDGEACNKSVNEASGGWMSTHEKMEVCTFNGTGHGACNGDSGSALVCDGVIVGVVSWGYPCAIGLPDMHSRISTYAEWIYNCMN